MNERIRELAHWVGLSSHDSIKLQQFAELIVEECALACVRTGVLEQDEDTGKMYADSVKEHFGVE